MFATYFDKEIAHRPNLDIPRQERELQLAIRVDSTKVPKRGHHRTDRSQSNRNRILTIATDQGLGGRQTVKVNGKSGAIVGADGISLAKEL